MKIVNPSDRKKLSTEQQNIKSRQIDKLSISEILHIVNNEDQTIAQKINQALPQIEKAVNVAEEVIRSVDSFFLSEGLTIFIIQKSDYNYCSSVAKYFFAACITFGDNKIVPIIVGITIRA